jgi:adenylate kinase family enzyme
MKKVLVIGCCGAGKSTFSLKLSKIINIDVIHLDSYYWKPNWTEPKKGEWRNCISSLCERESWIMDGNYNGTLEYRIQKADTILFLYMSTISCLFNVLKRIGTKVRPDIILGCTERFEWNFIKYTYNFNSEMAPAINTLLSKYKTSKEIHVFRNRKETKTFLHQLSYRTECG